jgi:hypothetical protein
VTNISQPSVVPQPGVEQTRSDITRPLKRTYAVAGQFIEDHSILVGQTLTIIARSGGLRYHSEGDEMEKN